MIYTPERLFGNLIMKKSRSKNRKTYLLQKGKANGAETFPSHLLSYYFQTPLVPI